MQRKNGIDMSNVNLNKRQFLRGSLLLAGTGLAGAGLLGSAGLLSGCSVSQRSLVKRNSKVGLQLYTVRDWMREDVMGTLERVAALGYREVEFAGYFDHSPKAIATKMAKLGLTSPSAHYSLQALQTSFTAILDNAKILGHRYIVLPYLTAQEQAGGIDTYKKLADFLDNLGKQCRTHDIQLAYHHHAFEFEDIGGQRPFDILLQVPDTHLKIEIDLYWMAKAKQDPLAYFADFPGRFPLWHVKDMDTQGEFADVGKGIIDFATLFAQRDQAGLQHAFVERDKTDNIERTLVTGFTATTELLKR